MGISTTAVDRGAHAVTMDHPPVNALPGQGWFDVADAVNAAAVAGGAHVVVPRAEGGGIVTEAGDRVAALQERTS